MALAHTPCLFLFVAVINAANAASSLGNKTDLIQNGSSCIVSDIFICKGAGAPDGCPLEMTTSGLSKGQTKAILMKHNQVRRKVAKGKYEFANQLNAANMKKLVWKDKLASSAQERVDQCNTEANHSDGTFDDPGAEASFGRSWLLSDPGNAPTATEDYMKIIQHWFDLVIIGLGNQTDPPFEFSKTDISWLTMAESGSGSGLISAETESLGCGLVIYSRENWRKLEMLCYYDSPTKDPVSGPKYEVGPPCSSCQPGFSCDDGLCASNNPQEE